MDGKGEYRNRKKFKEEKRMIELIEVEGPMESFNRIKKHGKIKMASCNDNKVHK